MAVAPNILEDARRRLLREGRNALAEATLAIEYIWSRRVPPDPDGGGYLVSDGDMVTALRTLVMSFGLASTILFDGGARRRSENAGMFALRHDRVEHVRQLTADIDTAIFDQRSIRNKFAHVDEYLAKLLLRGPANWIVDLGLSRREMIRFNDAGGNYCRVYIFDEERLLHLGEEFDVRQAYEAMTAVLAILPEL